METTVSSNFATSMAAITSTLGTHIITSSYSRTRRIFSIFCYKPCNGDFYKL